MHTDKSDGIDQVIHEQYRNLSPDLKLLLRLVEFSHGNGRPEDLGMWLKESGITLQSGKAFTQVWCKEQVKTLDRIGLLLPEKTVTRSRMGYVVHPALEYVITESNSTDPFMAELAGLAPQFIMSDIYSRSWAEEEWMYKQILFMVMALQTRHAQLMQESVDELRRFRETSWRGKDTILPPATMDLLRYCLPELLARSIAPDLDAITLWILESRLHYLVSNLEMFPGEFDVLSACPVAPVFASLVQDILAMGRLVGADLGVLCAVPQGDVSPFRLSVRCLALILSGREEEARTQHAALLTPDGGPFFVDTPLYAFLAFWSIMKGISPVSKLQSWLKDNQTCVAGWGGMVRAILRHRGKAEAWKLYVQEVQALPGAGKQGFLWAALASVALDASNKSDWLRQILTARDYFLGAGSLWIALELTKLLEQCNHPSALPEHVLAARNRVGLTQPLVSLLGGVSDWELKLDMLQALKLGGGRKTVSTDTEQICWLLDPENAQIVPVLRKIGKNGAWSNPKSVSLRTLAKRIHPAILPEDIPILAWLDNEYFAPDFKQPDALIALVGHPRIFLSDAPDTPIKLVSTELALTSREESGQVHVGLSAPLDQVGQLERLDTHTFQVLCSSPEIRKVAEVVGNGFAIPREGIKRATEVLGQLARAMPVESPLLTETAQSEQRPADSRPVLLLIPDGAGILVELHVRPLGDTGVLVRPGQGSPQIHLAQAGRILVTRRNPEDEKQSLQSLLDACPTLAEWLQGDFSARIPDPAANLAILSELRDYGTRAVVEWPKGEKLRIYRPSTSARKGLRLKEDNKWFQLEGNLTLDDQRLLELKDILASLPGAIGNFLPIGENEYLEIESQLLRQLKQIWRIGELKGKTVRISPAALVVNEFLQDEDTVASADPQTRAVRQNLLEAFSQDFTLPDGLVAELRPYQMEGYQWLSRMAKAGTGACLADDMGLGKTVQTIALLSAQASLGPSLVLAPASVVANWVAEILKFSSNLDPLVFGGTDRDNRMAQLDALLPGQVLILTYGLLLTMEEPLLARDWNVLVLDEAHALKNDQAKRSKSAANLKARSRLALTGTPMQNHLGELWSLFDILNPGLLGSSRQFRERFLTPIEGQNDDSARQGLKNILKPFMLRRTKNQVLSDLPPKTEISLSLDLQEGEKNWYTALVLQAQEDVARWEAMGQNGTAQEGQIRIQMLAWMMKLRRACCHPSLAGGAPGLPTAKQEKLLELLQEMQENQHRALVFSQFTDHLALIKDSLTRWGISFEYLDGSTPLKERTASVARFQSGSAPVFLISLGAGGTGLNLTGADYVIHLDPWWNPAIEDQASDRAHRIGQTRPVTVYRLIAAGTIEERIIALHRRKRDLADALLEGTEAAARLGTQDLLDLLRL